MSKQQPKPKDTTVRPITSAWLVQHPDVLNMRSIAIVKHAGHQVTIGIDSMNYAYLIIPSRDLTISLNAANATIESYCKANNRSVGGVIVVASNVDMDKLAQFIHEGVMVYKATATGDGSYVVMPSGKPYKKVAPKSKA